MATGTTQVRVQEQPAASGYGLVIGVGVAATFAVIMTLLNVGKENLLTETTMLSVALTFFSASAALYIGFGVTGNERHFNFASLMSILGFLATTGAAAHRWHVSGHAPFASIYEMLLSFVWTVALVTQLAERKFAVKLIGSVTMPIAVVSVGLMHLLNSEVRPLVPALQSTWLHIHVTLAMLSYAACALSFALAMMFLIKDNMKTDTFLAATSAMSVAIYLGIMTRFEKWGGLNVVAWDAATKSEMNIPNSGAKLYVTIPELGWVFALAMLAAAAPLVLYAVAKLKKDDFFLTIANRAVFVALALQVLAGAFFYLRVNNAVYPSLDVEGSFPTALAASPFILSGLATGVFGSLLYLMLYWRRSGLEKMLPSADILDRVTYKTICIGFPLLTLMIAAGAYWANRTWGSYWSWDPKETWAAITWLVYAGYLHMRITRGWRGRRAAYFAIIGFAVVMFTFFGVTYLLPGLHAYA
ncbi:MAG TPA: c-type cytochrome biogenesis protein CcsB [Terriglobales bacterium]|nr:c-type cytochrome biogenesis protein CcsB [Terriglobales bacterium]